MSSGYPCLTCHNDGYLMSFQVRLPHDLVRVEAGSKQPMAFEITHSGEQADTYEIVIEGLDVEWYSIPVGTVTVQPGETVKESIFLNPRRSSENVAGLYAFVIRVRSLETGEAVSTPASLQIEAFHHLSVDVQPKKGVLTPARKSCEFSVTVINLGNAEHTVQLTATDVDDQCAFEFDPPTVTVGPGQERTVSVLASSQRRPLLANSRLFGFTVTARSSSNPSVVATAQGQLEQRALASPGAFFVVLAVLLIVGAWIVSFPKPPQIRDFVVSPESSELGQQINIAWRTEYATSIEITVDGAPLKKALTASGSFEFKPQVAKEYVIQAIAANGRRVSSAVTRTLSVVEPPPTPEPRILSFTVSKKSANVGEPVILSYSINDAVTKVVLEPKDLELDPRLKTVQKEVVISQEGNNEFTLTVFNAAGQTDRATVSVKGVKASVARIIAFQAIPQEVQDTTQPVTVSWQVLNAVRVELVINGVPELLTTLSGTQVIAIAKTSKIVLRAYDAEGLTVTREETVSVVPKPTPDPNPPIGPDGLPKQPEQGPPTSHPETKPPTTP